MLIAAYAMNLLYFVYASMLLIFLAIVLVLMEPFKTSAGYYGLSNTMFVLLLAIMYLNMIGYSMEYGFFSALSYLFTINAVIASVLPLLYISAIFVHWLYSRRHVGMRRHGYASLY
jgi:membrane-bound ClpP family serine protease